MLDPKKVAMVITSRLHPSGAQEDGPADGSDPLLPMAEDLISAIEKRSAPDVVDAIKALFMACDSYSDDDDGGGAT